MVYTEVKEKKGSKYYYRAKSVRNGKKISKERIYLGRNLSKRELVEKERGADKKLISNEVNKKLNKLKLKIVRILKKSKIKKAGIFGSYVKGKQKKGSDVDIIIEPTKNMSLLDLSGLKIELEEALNGKVDLISYNYIHPCLKKEILESEVRII